MVTVDDGDPPVAPDAIESAILLHATEDPAHHINDDEHDEGTEAALETDDASPAQGQSTTAGPETAAAPEDAETVNRSHGRPGHQHHE